MSASSVTDFSDYYTSTTAKRAKEEKEAVKSGKVSHNDFLKLLLGLISTSNILEVDLYLVRATHAGTTLAKGHDTATTALGLLHNEEPYTDQQQDWQHR